MKSVSNISQNGSHTGLRTAPPTLLLLLAFAFLVAIYAMLRYGAHWGEVDTATFSEAIYEVLHSGRLIPDTERYIYPNGYGYQALATFLVHTLGIEITPLQTYGALLLMPWLVLPAWLLYTELTGSRRGAALATLILLIQPEFLFPVLRGTHEKFTRGLMLMCLYLIVRSLRSRREPGRFAAYVLCFYLCAYALVTYNNLITTSFIFSIGLALILSWALLRWTHDALEQRPGIQRLTYAVAGLIILSFIFTFYGYAPAQSNLFVLQSVFDRVVALLLNLAPESRNPYGVVLDGWINLPVYLLMSLANWLLLLLSAGLWFGQSWRFFRRREKPQSEQELLLWALYGAFAAVGALSIAVDISGAIASNLQHRVFPSFAMLAAPIIARKLQEMKIDGTEPAQQRTGRLARYGLCTAVGILAVLSVLKATNEPTLSNKWVFHTPAELSAVEWAEAYLPHHSVWTGYDERLTAAITIRDGGAPSTMDWDGYDVDAPVRDFIISDVTRSRSLRLERDLPVAADSFITFDNGQTQVFHLRPETPYQQ